MHDVICKRRGKEEVVFTGDLPKAKDYMKRMRDCQCGGIRNQRVEYCIRPSESTEKYKKPPHYKNGRSH